MMNYLILLNIFERIDDNVRWTQLWLNQHQSFFRYHISERVFWYFQISTSVLPTHVKIWELAMMEWICILALVLLVILGTTARRVRSLLLNVIIRKNSFQHPWLLRHRHITKVLCWTTVKPFLYALLNLSVLHCDSLLTDTFACKQFLV